jgi:hypothetical protein
MFQAKREQLINEIRGLVAADGCIWDVFERWLEWVESKGARKRWIKIGDLITKIWIFLHGVQPRKYGRKRDKHGS